MADSYIDPFETVVYGTHAREMIAEHVREPAAARSKALGAVLDFVVETQASADGAMTAVLARAPAEDTDDASILKAQDAMTRFASWIGSLEGQPLTVAQFYGNVVPSQAAKRRGAKMVGVLGQVVERLDVIVHGEHDGKKRKKPKKQIPGADEWLADLKRFHGAADKRVKAKTKAKVDQRALTPEVAAARGEWLATYVANKALVEGVLRHLGKTSLMDVVFDDLAEVQRTASPDAGGVAATPAAGAAPNAASSAT